MAVTGVASRATATSHTVARGGYARHAERNARRDSHRRGPEQFVTEHGELHRDMMVERA